MWPQCPNFTCCTLIWDMLYIGIMLASWSYSIYLAVLSHAFQKDIWIDVWWERSFVNVMFQAVDVYLSVDRSAHAVWPYILECQTQALWLFDSGKLMWKWSCIWLSMRGCWYLIWCCTDLRWRGCCGDQMMLYIHSRLILFLRQFSQGSHKAKMIVTLLYSSSGWGHKMIVTIISLILSGQSYHSEVIYSKLLSFTG